jgi:hypothetical protein
MLRRQALILLLAFVLVPGRESRGDIGLVVMEPVRALGLTTRVGHAGTYLSNICPDGSPVRMRLCRPGERGSILSRYSDLGGTGDYDWAIVSLDQFLNGSDRQPVPVQLTSTPTVRIRRRPSSTCCCLARCASAIGRPASPCRRRRASPRRWSTGRSKRPAQAFEGARVRRALREVKAARQAEVDRVLGSKAQWQAFDRECRAVVREWRGAQWLPDDVRLAFASFEPTGRLSSDLLTYLDAHGHFYLDEDDRGAWISLPLDGVEPVATGLSALQVLAGDRRLSFLVLAAVIDYNLYASDERRETVEHMDPVFALVREARSSLTARSGRDALARRGARASGASVCPLSNSTPGVGALQSHHDSAASRRVADVDHHATFQPETEVSQCSSQ